MKNIFYTLKDDDIITKAHPHCSSYYEISYLLQLLNQSKMRCHEYEE